MFTKHNSDELTTYYPKLTHMHMYILLSQTDAHALPPASGRRLSHAVPRSCGDTMGNAEIRGGELRAGLNLKHVS